MASIRHFFFGMFDTLKNIAQNLALGISIFSMANLQLFTFYEAVFFTKNSKLCKKN